MRRTKGWIFMAGASGEIPPHVTNVVFLVLVLPPLSCRRIGYSEGTATPWFMGLR